MNPTEVERLILVNQYRILAILDPKNKESYDLAADTFMSGYEGAYDWHTEFADVSRDGLTKAQCDEVMDILSMYAHLQRSYDRLQDKSGVKPERVDFPGFDGNSETELMSFCRFLVKSDKFAYVRQAGRDDFNSHMGMLGNYRRMLSVYRPIRDPGVFLTLEQIKAVLYEDSHPNFRERLSV